MQGSTGVNKAEGNGTGAAPRMLGRYELLGKLGTGGMASVYLGRSAGEAGFQRLFAIKVLHPHLAEDASFVKMLLDEAKIAARIHHPNVVPIVDLGVDSGMHYVVMEYVEGASLSALLRKHRDDRPPRMLVPIVLDMLAGLDAAHSLKDEDGKPLHLVHRDVSPQNVLVGIDGSARITDFGIARAESRVHSTKPGQLKGKIAYMSPEQIKSGSVDRRSDVFSAGAMLWSALTGRRLFQGENDAATMSNIMHMDIPLPSTVGLKPPAVFDAICLCALQRNLDRRFATAQEMEEALHQASAREGLIASRRELAGWVEETFKDELVARRAAIRAEFGGDATLASGTMGAVAGLPMLTPSAVSMHFQSSEIPVANAHGTTGLKEPPTKLLDVERAETPAPTPARKTLLIAIGAACVLALAGVGVWKLPSSSGSKQDAATPDPAPATATVQADTERKHDPNEAATRYLAEAEKMLGMRRIEAAEELVERAKQVQTDDPEIVIKLANLGEQVTDARLRATARKTSDLDAAIEAAQQLLDRNPDDPEAVQLLAAAKGKKAEEPAKATARGKLSIETQAGAAIYVDDDLVGRGSLANRVVAAGGHTIVIRQKGFLPQRRTVQIGADKETKLSISLEKAPAVVATAPPLRPAVAALPPRPSPPTPSVTTPTPPTTPVTTPAANTPPPVIATAKVPSPTTTPPAPTTTTPTATTAKVTTPAPAASTEIAAPRLPGNYSANNMKELGKVLAVIEGEAITKGGAPASMRGVTNGLAEEAFSNFSPGTAIELHPSAIYYVIVKGVRAGKSASAIAAELRAGHARGTL